MDSDHGKRGKHRYRKGNTHTHKTAVLKINECSVYVYVSVYDALESVTRTTWTG